VDLVGFEPTTSSMPFPSTNCNRRAASECVRHAEAHSHSPTVAQSRAEVGTIRAYVGPRKLSDPFWTNYSYRSATIGSVVLARRAGK
jgi:hypothetical protein